MEPVIWVLCSQEPATGGYPQPNESTLHSHSLSLRFILILFSHLCLHLQVVSFLKVIWLTYCTHFALNCLLHALLSDLPWFWHSNNIWWEVQHFQFLRYTFSPEHLVLKHPQSIFNVRVLKTGRGGDHQYQFKQNCSVSVYKPEPHLERDLLHETCNIPGMTLSEKQINKIVKVQNIHLEL